jgi:hypothetical protein
MHLKIYKLTIDRNGIKVNSKARKTLIDRLGEKIYHKKDDV